MSRDCLDKFSALASSRLGAVTILFTEFALLLVAYLLYVSEIWNYQGFNSNLSISKGLISGVVLFMFAALGPRRKDAVLFFSYITHIFVLIPILVIYSAGGGTDRLVVLSVIGTAVMLVTASFARLKTIKLPKVRDNHIIFLCLAICAVNLIGIILVSGFKYVNFDVFKVYDFREEARRALPGFFGYLYAFSVKAALPIGFVLAARSKSWLLLVLVVLFSISFFALTANRAPLLQVFLLGGVYWTLGKKNSESYFLVGIIALILISILSFSFSGNTPPTLGTLVIYRMLLVPALTTWQYFDYFGTYGDFFHWADSKVTLGLVGSPDSLPMINVIGDEYWGGAHVAANVGWLGSGYGNAGTVGIIIYSILLGLVLAYVHAYGKKIGYRVSASLMFMPIFYALTAADFVTLLVSHGLGMSMLVLSLLASKENGQNSPVQESMK